MSGYLLTPAADADIEEIWQYVAASSGESRADALERELHAAMRRLGEMPGIGHPRHDLADEPLCFFSVHNFLVIFRPETRPIQVVRVLHGARDVHAILESNLADPR